MACHTMPIQQLHDLTQKAFNKHKASTKGVCKDPTDSELHNLESNTGTRRHPALLQYKTHLQKAQSAEDRAITMATDPGPRPTTGRNHGKGHPHPANTTACPTTVPRIHPRPHPSHRCQTDAAQGQLDTPTSELQELLSLANELLEQNSTEEYCEGQTSDSLPDATSINPSKGVASLKISRHPRSSQTMLDWSNGPTCPTVKPLPTQLRQAQVGAATKAKRHRNHQTSGDVPARTEG